MDLRHCEGPFQSINRLLLAVGTLISGSWYKYVISGKVKYNIHSMVDFESQAPLTRGFPES